MGITQAIRIHAPYTLRLFGVMALGLAASILIPGYAKFIGLNNCDTSWLKVVVSLVGYSLAFGNVAHLLISCFWLLLTAFAIESNFSRTQIVTLWLAATVVFGAAQLLTSDTCLPFIGQPAIPWAYVGCALVLIPTHWRVASPWKKFYFSLCVCAVLRLTLEYRTDALPSISALLTGVVLMGIVVSREPRHRWSRAA